MTGTAANILLGGARVFVAPAVEAMPADSTAYGAAWGGNWEDLGFTSSPLAWAPALDTIEAEVEQSPLPMKRQVSKERHAFETTLAEITADNLSYALRGTVSPTTAGPAQVGKEELEAGGLFTLTEYSVGFEGVYVDSSGNEFPVRVVIHKATITINGSIEFAKNAQTGIPMHMEALADTTKDDGKQAFIWQRVTEAATS